MENVFLTLLNNSISASWLALTVLLLRPLLKKMPKSTRCALWLLVGLRLCLPIRVESVLSLIPSAQTVSPSIVYARQPAIDSGIEAVNRVVNPVITETFAPTPAASANPLQVWLFIAAWVWLIGFGLMLLYCAVSTLLLRRRVARSFPLREGANIRLCERVASPFVLGIIRPEIYLPTGLEEQVMELAIAHEQAHIRRGDHVFRLLGFLLLSVYWFNPLLWLGFILLCRDMELACDERVLQTLGPEKKKDYSRALLICSAPRHAFAACPVAFGETGVKERIKSILKYKAPTRWALTAAVVLVSAVALCFLTNPPGLRLDTQADPVVSARSMDLRLSAPDEREYNTAQLDELNSRLRLLDNCRESRVYEGWNRAYFISAETRSGETVTITGYSVNEELIDIQVRGKRYVVEDPDFCRYVNRFCIGADRAEALDVEKQADDFTQLTVDGERYFFIGRWERNGGDAVMTEGLMMHVLPPEVRAETYAYFDGYYRVYNNDFTPKESNRISYEEAEKLIAEYRSADTSDP